MGVILLETETQSSCERGDLTQVEMSRAFPKVRETWGSAPPTGRESEPLTMAEVPSRGHPAAGEWTGSRPRGREAA